MQAIKKEAKACQGRIPSSGHLEDGALGRAGVEPCQTLAGVRPTLTVGVRVANAALYINISNHKHTRWSRLTGYFLLLLFGFLLDGEANTGKNTN